jgi:hypothetical protein
MLDKYERSRQVDAVNVTLVEFQAAQSFFIIAVQAALILCSKRSEKY